jgi:hypothetical protein
MPRRLATPWLALAILEMASCAQSADDRARKAGLRAREQSSTRESETVRRAMSPHDPHRLLYHAPDDLSDSSARETRAAIVGIEKVPQPTKPAVHSGSPPLKPPR